MINLEDISDTTRIKAKYTFVAKIHQQRTAGIRHRIIETWQTRYRRNQIRWHFAMQRVVRRMAKEIRDEIDKEIIADIVRIVGTNNEI
jgi:hypothetical protein